MYVFDQINESNRKYAFITLLVEKNVAIMVILINKMCDTCEKLCDLEST